MDPIHRIRSNKILLIIIFSSTFPALLSIRVLSPERVLPTVSSVLTGLITLFTFSISATLIGVQVASSRYTYRLSSSLLGNNKITIWFSLNMLSIIFGVYISISGKTRIGYVFLFLLLSYISIWSAIAIPQQVFSSINQKNLMGNIIGEMDTEFVESVDSSIEKVEIDYGDGSDGIRRSKKQVRYQSTELDIRGKFEDLVSSYLDARDLYNAKTLTKKYLEKTRKILVSNYSEFSVSLTHGQHVALFLISPVRSLTTTLPHYDREQYLLDVCRILNEEMKRWESETQFKIPEAYTETITYLIDFYTRNSSFYKSRDIQSELKDFSRLIKKEKNLKGVKKYRDLTVSQYINIINAMGKISILALRERGDHRLCSTVGLQLRKCCDIMLKDPGRVPKRHIIYLRIIGCELASQDVNHEVVYDGADVGTSTREPAGEILLHLLWMRDKVEGYNIYTSSLEAKNIINSQIDQLVSEIVVNDIEEKSLSSKEIDIIKAIRKVRGRASVKDIYARCDGDLEKQSIEEILSKLTLKNVVGEDGGEGYQIV